MIDLQIGVEVNEANKRIYSNRDEGSLSRVNAGLGLLTGLDLLSRA